MKLQQLLTNLQKVRRTGKDTWVACCPAHGDKNPSMTVTASPSTILVHCFAGCGIEEILGAVGMCVSDLYPEREEGYNRGPKQTISLRAALECLSFEALVVSASAATMKKRALTDDESTRLQHAAARIHAAMRMTGVTQ